MTKRNWNDDYVTQTVIFLLLWIVLAFMVLLIANISSFIVFISGSAMGWLLAVFASRSINDKL